MYISWVTKPQIKQSEFLQITESLLPDARRHVKKPDNVNKELQTSDGSIFIETNLSK